MAVISAKRSFSVRGGDSEIREEWRVVAAAEDSIPTILADSEVPAIGSAHPDNASFKVATPRQLTPSRNDEGQGYWDLSLHYRVPGIGQTRRIIGKTSTRLLALSYETQPYDVPAEQGYIWESGSWSASKRPVLNSAGDPFDPPITHTLNNTVLRFRQTESDAFNEAAAIALQGTINSAQITVCGYTIPAEKGIIRDISPNWNGEAWETEYAIEIEIQYPLNPEILDRGFRYLKAGKITEIRYSDISDDYKSSGDNEEEDKPVSDPELLDGAGGLATRDAAGIVQSPAYLKYRFAELNDWSGLNLVSTI